MNKKVFIGLAVLGLALGLSSCHGRKAIPNFNCPTEFDSSREYDISFWAKNDSNPTQRQIYVDAITEFNKYYPNIHVSIQHFSSYPELFQQVLQNISTDTTPNVCISYPDHVATYLEVESRIVELEDLANNSKYGLDGSEVKFKSPSLSEFVPEYIQEGYLNMNGLDKLYTLPFMRSNECMYVNKTWLETNGFELPKDNIFSWDYVWEIARYARTKSTKMSPLVYQSSDNFFIQLAYQNNNPYTTKSGDILFNNEDNKKFVTDLNALYKEKLFITKANTGEYPGDKLNKGEAVFGIDSSAGSTWIGSDSPLSTTKGDPFEVLVTTVPQVDVNKPLTMSQGPSLCVFNKTDEQEVLASWIFTQYLLTIDVQVAYSKTEGYSPVTNTAINSSEFQSFLKSDDTYYVQKQAINNVIANRSHSYVTPAFNGSALVRENVGKIINNAALSYKKEINVDELFAKALRDSGVI